MEMFTNFLFNRLNREAASPKNKPSKIIENLDLHDGDVVGDIGAGGGISPLNFPGT